MSSFTVGGLSTGVDYNELISKLMEIKRKPIEILESKKDTYNDRMSSYSELSTKLADLKTAVEKMKTSAGFYVRTASVSDETVVEASATGGASPGSYSVTVTSLASEEKEVHDGSGLTSSSDIVNSSGGDRIFEYTYAGTQRTLTVADGTTLDGLKNLINDDIDNPGVNATVVNDGTNYRLIITGNETGASQGITIDAGTNLDGTGGTVDFTSASFSENKTAGDADFSIDGLQVSRSSNAISDVISGVTINLKKENSSATVTVSTDSESIKDQLQDFVSAYNDVMTFLSTSTAYDSVSETSGILSGEASARSIQNRVRELVSGSVSGLSGSLSVLAEAGITTDYKTGNLKVDDAVLDTKLGTSIDDIADLFKDADNGIATRIHSYINDITSTIDGPITLRKKGLQEIIENINDTIKNMEFRIEKTEDDLVRRFTALEKLVGSYNTIGNYLTNFSTSA